VYQNLKLAEKKVDILKSLDLESKKYFLVTTHREENVDDKKRFENILRSLQMLNKKYDVPVVYPIHPRSQKMIERFGLNLDGVKTVEPVDFLGFLQLEDNARLVLTDSGGVQEETCILGTPCVTLRENTERPETIQTGGNIIAGVKPEKIIECASTMIKNNNKWVNPFGDGNAGEKIVNILKENNI